MTTNETLWFRDESPFITIREKIFPEFISLLRQGKRSEIRIWSAACSSGQEPYSLSILAHEFARTQGGLELINGKMSIIATDISPSVLMLAKLGKYDAISMSRGMPDDLKDRYFEQQGRIYTVKSEIQKMVTFQQLNLMDSFSPLGRFDLVLLRNVAIYFSADFKIKLFKRIAQTLNPGGYLILGSSESLHGYSQDYQTCSHGRCNYYQVAPSEVKI